MYANADMLFDEGLIKTLEYLKFFPQRLDKMMMVGVRTNINASLITNVYKWVTGVQFKVLWSQISHKYLISADLSVEYALCLALSDNSECFGH